MESFKKLVLGYEFGGHKHHALGFMLSALFILIIGVVDFITGSELSSSFFYLLPVTIAVMMCGRSSAFVVSFLCAVVWLYIDLHSGGHYSSVFILYWNGMTRLGYYLVHSFLLSFLLDLLKEQQQLAVRDSLTGAYNWRIFNEILTSEWKNMDRTSEPLTLCYFDIDDFKSINDQYGHSQGDEVLKAISKSVTGNLRAGDILARMGGDEFIVLLRRTNGGEAKKIMERIVDSLEYNSKDLVLSPRLSIGIVTFKTQPLSVNEMITKADILMYEAKKQGKNRIFCREFE